MTVVIFAFIAWVIISIYSFIPKRLSLVENLLLFFLITIITISVSTVIDLNLRLVLHSYKPELFVGFWLKRSIIVPLSLSIFGNSLITFKSRSKKTLVGILVFLFLLFIELLAVRMGIKAYNGWNLYLAGMLIATFMLIAFFTTKVLIKLPERNII